MIGNFPIGPVSTAHGDTGSRSEGEASVNSMILPMRYLYDWIVRPTLQDQDTSTARRRKAVTVWLLFCSLFVAVFIIFQVRDLSQGNFKNYAIVRLCVNTCFVIVCMLIYAVIRHYRECTVRMTQTVMVLWEGYAIYASVVNNHNLPLLLFGVAVLSILSCDGFAALFVMLAWNLFISIDMRFELDLVITEKCSGLDQSAAQLFVLDIIILIITPLIVGTVLSTIINENMELTSHTAAAEDMSRIVAAQLSQYDLDSAEETLTDYMHDVDRTLLKNFTLIVQNLRSYRPFLPAWVVEPEMDDSPTVHGSDSGTHTELISLDDGSPRATLALAIHPIPSPASPCSSDVSVNAGGLQVSTNPLHRVRRTPPVSPSAAILSCTHRATMVQAVVGIVEIATKPVAGGHLQAFLNSVIAMLSSEVREHRGYIHDFRGDSALFSWSAAGRIARAETHAAEFALSINRHKDPHGQTFSSAFMSGPVTAFSAGTDDHKLFCIGSDWNSKLFTLSRAAVYHRTIAVDGKFYRQAKDEFEIRAIDRVQADGSGPLDVYELVKDRQPTSKEWMYQLDTQAADVHSEITAIQELFVLGAFDGGMTRFEKLPSEVREYPTVRAMVELAVSCRKNSAPFVRNLGWTPV